MDPDADRDALGRSHATAIANNRGSRPALAGHWFLLLQNALGAWSPYLLDLFVFVLRTMGLFLSLFSFLPAKFAVHHRRIDYIAQTSLYDVVRSLSSAVPVYARVHSFTRNSLSLFVALSPRSVITETRSEIVPIALLYNSQKSNFSETAIPNDKSYLCTYQKPQTVKMHFSMKALVLATLAAGQAYAASIAHQHSSAHSHARKHNHVEQ